VPIPAKTRRKKHERSRDPDLFENSFRRKQSHYVLILRDSRDVLISFSRCVMADGRRVMAVMAKDCSWLAMWRAKRDCVATDRRQRAELASRRTLPRTMRRIASLVLTFLAVTADGFAPPPSVAQPKDCCVLLATRRESFGEIMGSVMLVPAATAAVAVPNAANAKDEYDDPYPFKVSSGCLS